MFGEKLFPTGHPIVGKPAQQILQRAPADVQARRDVFHR
jgi:hypothetical protein